MNINPDKVKELVLLFSELDDDYQGKLLLYAHELSIKQSQKGHILKEGKTFKDKTDLDKETEKKSY